MVRDTRYDGTYRLVTIKGVEVEVADGLLLLKQGRVVGKRAHGRELGDGDRALGRVRERKELFVGAQRVGVGAGREERDPVVDFLRCCCCR